MRRGIPNAHIPNSHRFSEHTPRILDFYRKVQTDKVFGRLPKAYLVANGTKKDKKVLIDPASPASTITTHPDEFIHFRAPRNITVREMARIQSFPDDFVFKGRYTINGPRRKHDVARCSQVGNAVPPLLAEAVGWALHDFQRMLSVATSARECTGGGERQSTRFTFKGNRKD
jgi:DNA (cytosine-5)-methyltransferase 1